MLAKYVHDNSWNVENLTIGETQVIDGVKHMEVTIYYRFVGAMQNI
jgi:hypothetical protein